MLELLRQQALAFTALELIAVVSALVYLLLAIREHIACWVFAAVSTTIYVYLFFSARLYMESVLNLFYLAMACYGWITWRRGGPEQNTLSVSRWPLLWHVVAILAIVTASALNGYMLVTWTDAAYPYIDSLTTWGAIWATFLVARKVLENWWYWLLIDAVLVVIYWSRGLELTALLFVLYIGMIPFGLLAWTKSYRRDRVVAGAGE